MALQLFTWITQLVDNLRHRDDDDDDEGILSRLPDCLLIDILSRLPADCLLRFQSDCKVWKALISSHYFSTLHIRRARPVLIIQCDRNLNSLEQSLYVFDENLDNEEKTFTKVLLKRELMISKLKNHKPYLQYSCEGVLLLTSSIPSPPTTYFIFNPITQEEVTIQHKTFDPGYLCAFYYRSSTREFKLLYVQERKSESRCKYSIYTVTTQTWKEIHCPTAPNLLLNDSPAIVNGAVHLLVNKDLGKPDTPPCAKGIMVLNIDKEELSTMPHPGRRVCSSWGKHQTTSLLVKDETLSFCQFFMFKNAMDIWILEDYETWSWTKRCKVNLLFDNQGISSNNPFIPLSYWQVASHVSSRIQPLYFMDRELVFYWCDRGLFMCNLDHNTLRNIEGPRSSSPYTCKTYKKTLLTIA